MSLSFRSLRTGALRLGTAALATVFMAAAANAQGAEQIPTKGCYKETYLQPLMDADGQERLFVGKRLDEAVLLPGNLFTMNDKGYGYNLERDPKTRDLCITAYKDVKLNYPDNPYIPAWAANIAPSGGINVVNAYHNGGRLVFMATGFSRDAQGKEVSGNRIAIITGANKLASVWVVNARNIPDALFDMREFGIYDKNFTHFIGRGFVDASASGGRQASVGRVGSDDLLAQAPR